MEVALGWVIKSEEEGLAGQSKKGVSTSGRGTPAQRPKA